MALRYSNILFNKKAYKHASFFNNSKAKKKLSENQQKLSQCHFKITCISKLLLSKVTSFIFIGHKSYHLRQVSSNTDISRVQFELSYRKQSIIRPMPKELDIYLNTENMDCFNHKLMTKPPEYNTRHKSYMLDFKGRIKKSSSNNMQIINPNKADKILWQLGKMESKHYILDFRYPFTAFTAFATALSCLTRT